jgi:hypothetical protein
VLDLRRVCATLVLCRLQILLFWTLLEVIQLKFCEVHMVCHFFIEGGSSSMSVRELWPQIDQLDEVDPESSSVILTQNQGRD